MSLSLRERLIGPAVAAASIALLLLVFEAALRLAGPAGGGKESNEERLYTEYDPLLGWRKRPGGRSLYQRREYVTEVVINSRGLRDLERPCAPPPDTLRILALGDSFVEGYTVDLPHVVTQVLEQRLRAGGCPAEVINGGTNAYSTDQEYLFYRSEGVRYEPRIVLLFFYYNDIVYNDRQDYFGAPKPIFEMATGRLRIHRYPVKIPTPQAVAPASREPDSQDGGGLRVYTWVRDRVRYGAPRAYQRLARFGLWDPIPRIPLRLELRVYERRREPLIEESWTKTGAILRALARDVEGEGGKLLVIGVPSRLEVEQRTWEITQALYGASDATWNRRAVMERLGRVGAEHGFDVIDLTAAMRAAYESGKRPYFTYDGHWTARGHAIAAQEVERHIRRRGWLVDCQRGPSRASAQDAPGAIVVSEHRSRT